MDVFVTGDSHTAALRRGQMAIEADGLWPADVQLTIRPLGGGHLTREPFFVDRGDHAAMTAVEYRRNVERLPFDDDRSGNAAYGVSAPLHSARIWRHPAWFGFSPVAMTGAADTPVSSGMIKRLVLDDQRHVLDLLALLSRIGRRPFVIEAPYPFHHHPALRRTRAEVVSHLDGIYRATIRRELDRLGVPVVAVPDRCLEEGFMRPVYGRPGDHHHGNESFGRIMMEEVLAFLDRELISGRGSASPRPSNHPSLKATHA